MKRIMSRSFWSAVVLSLFLGSSAMAGDVLFQYSTIDALLAGVYDGRMTLRDLKYQGDFGIGTLNGLDGELIVLEGQAYHAAAGGKVDVPADTARIPFATVSFFQQDMTLRLKRVDSLKALNAAVLNALPSRNYFCAIRIDGTFSNLKARAIPKQKPPYAPLASVVKKQVVTSFSGKGTLVGFYSPVFVKGVNVPGFHWHFLTRNRQGGGHVLALAMKPAVASLDVLHGFSVKLPQDKPFEALDLSGDKSEELHAVETDPAEGE